MKKLKLRLYYWWLTILIIIPLIVTLNICFIRAIIDELWFKFLKRIGYIPKTERFNVFDCYSPAYSILEWRERKLKYYVRGYELTLKI